MVAFCVARVYWLENNKCMALKITISELWHFNFYSCVDPGIFAMGGGDRGVCVCGGGGGGSGLTAS